MTRGFAMAWPALAAFALVALTTWAGFWQLERAREKTRIAELAREMLTAPPHTIAPGDVNPDDYHLRRVVARGVFDPGGTIYLDNKVREGAAGYDVVSLLNLEGGRKPVLVNRGWVAQGPTRDELPDVPVPQGEVTIEGVARVPSERVLELSDETIQGKVWQNLDLERYHEVFGNAQPFIILQENEFADGLVRDRKPPDSGADKHRAYAVQWFALAALTVIFYLAASDERKRKGRQRLLLLLAFFAAPVIAATLAFNYWQPSSFTNYGELLPPRLLPDVALKSFDGEGFRLSDLRGKWILLMVDMGGCGEACRAKLYKMRQLRLTQGKNKDRVARVWLISDAAAPSAELKREYSGTRFVSAKASELLSQLPAAGEIEDHIYLLDAKGNLVMRYPKGADASRMVKDLNRLLRLSGE